MKFLWFEFSVSGFYSGEEMMKEKENIGKRKQKRLRNERKWKKINEKKKK